MRRVWIDHGVVSQWERLAGDAPPFLRPAFFVATARWLAPPGDPVLVSAHLDRELAAILPLSLHRGQLRALRSLHTPRFDLVGPADALGAMWGRLREDDRWYSLDLSGVPEDSPLAVALPELARRDGSPVVVTRRSASPYLPLADFERAIDGKFRRKLLARRRQVPDLSFERVTSADQGALEEVFRLEGAGWKGEAGTAILSSPATRGFYTELARRSAAAGALSLSLLRSGDKVIAAHFALEDHTAYYLLKPGYDPDFARFGPGHLLVYEAARDARDRGLSEFDFLGQEMAWKLAWTARRRRHLRIQIYRSGARGRAAHALFHVIRPALGRVRRAVRGAGRRPRVSDAVRPPAGAGVRTEPIESPGPTNPPGVISGG